MNISIWPLLETVTYRELQHSANAAQIWAIHWQFDEQYTEHQHNVI